VKRVFADASFFVALLSAKDQAHTTALRYAQELGGNFVTTTFVVSEITAFFARPPARQAVVRLLNDLHENPAFDLLHVDEALYQRAWAHYSGRMDKEWSLTDCTSFLVMRDRNIQDALTTDDHFEQAGFSALLK
jgi:uncharacterized protein